MLELNDEAAEQIVEAKVVDLLQGQEGFRWKVMSSVGLVTAQTFTHNLTIWMLHSPLPDSLSITVLFTVCYFPAASLVLLFSNILFHPTIELCQHHRVKVIQSVHCWFCRWLGPHSAWRAGGASAVSSRLPAFRSGAVPASCRDHCPDPAFRVEAGSFWHQPRLWPIWLPTKEQRPHQVRKLRRRIELYLYIERWRSLAVA